MQLIETVTGDASWVKLKARLTGAEKLAIGQMTFTDSTCCSIAGGRNTARSTFINIYNHQQRQQHHFSYSLYIGGLHMTTDFVRLPPFTIIHPHSSLQNHSHSLTILVLTRMVNE